MLQVMQRWRIVSSTFASSQDATLALYPAQAFRTQEVEDNECNAIRPYGPTKREYLLMFRTKELEVAVDLLLIVSQGSLTVIVTTTYQDIVQGTELQYLSPEPNHGVLGGLLIIHVPDLVVVINIHPRFSGVFRC
jgi:hypothetical protein